MEEQHAAAEPQQPVRGGDVPPAQVAPPPTGEPQVDEAVARLSELTGLPVAEHPAVFEDVHRQLAEALGELDPPATGR